MGAERSASSVPSGCSAHSSWGSLPSGGAQVFSMLCESHLCGSPTDGNKIFTIWNEIPTGAESPGSRGRGGNGRGFRSKQLLPSCGWRRELGRLLGTWPRSWAFRDLTQGHIRWSASVRPSRAPQGPAWSLREPSPHPTLSKPILPPQSIAALEPASSLPVDGPLSPCGLPHPTGMSKETRGA